MVTITTVAEGNQVDPIAKVRAEVFLDTALAHKKLGVKILAVHQDCCAHYIDQLKSLGVILVEQQTEGMGAVRREAMQAGLNFFPRANYLWSEPEKPNLLEHVVAMTVQAGLNGSSYFFNRISMNSYPPEQAHYYLFVREVAKHLVGFDWDYAFGPMLLTRESMPLFLEYQGEYGDLWDSILVPRLRVIRKQLPYTLQDISFINDPRMTAIEVGNSKVILKRVRQLQNVIPSLIAEWGKGD